MIESTDNNLKAFAAADDQFGPDSSDSSQTIDVPRHHEGPSVDLSGNAGDTEDHTLLDADYYLKFTDDFRERLETCVAIYDEELDMISSVLEEILAREAVGKNPMPFGIIIYSRLEKLLKSLINYPARSQQASQPNFRKVLKLAVALQRRWQMRFRDKLFNTDNERIIHMVMYGILAHVTMQPSPKGDGSAEWVAKWKVPGAGTDFLNFPLGQ